MSGRFEALDGLRGVAALAVVLHHAGPALVGNDLFHSAYLAVDFFFMLSGFVVAAAYEGRMRSGMDGATFFLVRLRRLYPVIVVGILAGALVHALQGAPWLVIGIVMARELLFVPTVQGREGIYALNGVQWSLLFELLANVVHVLLLRRLGVRGLAVVVASSFAVLAVASARFGWLGIGDRGESILVGIPRVLFPYSVGLIAFRLWDAGKLTAPSVPSRALLLTFPLLFFTATALEAVMPAWIGDLAVVAHAFPLVLVAGVGSSISGISVTVARFLGAISYPLYGVHLAVIAAVKLAFPDGGIAPYALAVGGSLVCATAVALWIEPSARYLRRFLPGVPAAVRA